MNPNRIQWIQWSPHHWCLSVRLCTMTAVDCGLTCREVVVHPFFALGHVVLQCLVNVIVKHGLPFTGCRDSGTTNGQMDIVPTTAQAPGAPEIVPPGKCSSYSFLALESQLLPHWWKWPRSIIRDPTSFSPTHTLWLSRIQLGCLWRLLHSQQAGGNGCHRYLHLGNQKGLVNKNYACDHMKHSLVCLTMAACSIVIDTLITGPHATTPLGEMSSTSSLSLVNYTHTLSLVNHTHPVTCQPHTHCHLSSTHTLSLVNHTHTVTDNNTQLLSYPMPQPPPPPPPHTHASA